MHEGPVSGGPKAGLRFEISRYEQRDREALLEFRRDHYGAEAVQADPAYVDWQFRDAPGIGEEGAPLIVAKSEGRIVGTIGKIRTLLYVRGKPAPAAWAIDFAVQKDLRRGGIGEAISAVSRQYGGTGLSLEGTPPSRGIAKRLAYGMIAEVPLFVRAIDPAAWLRSHNVPAPLAWFTRAALPVLAALDSVALRSARTQALELVETPAFDDRADALFAALSRRYPVLCRRDRGWLEWRFERYPRRGRYRLYWLLRAGEVAGYAVLRPGTHHGLPAGVLVDYLCAPELIRALLGLCIPRLREMGAALATCVHLNALGGGAFRSLGFLRRSSGWQFLVRPEPAALAPAILDARNWFLTGADSNVDRERDPL
jgi:L-amino acid N-acyltransferase YncA